MKNPAAKDPAANSKASRAGAASRPAEPGHAETGRRDGAKEGLMEQMQPVDRQQHQCTPSMASASQTPQVAKIITIITDTARALPIEG